eukprot:1043853-Rhodomonas_salina.2
MPTDSAEETRGRVSLAGGNYSGLEAVVAVESGGARALEGAGRQHAEARAGVSSLHQPPSAPPQGRQLAQKSSTRSACAISIACHCQVHDPAVLVPVKIVGLSTAPGRVWHGDARDS